MYEIMSSDLPNSQWLVPTLDTTFGKMLKLPHKDDLVIVLYRGNHGWSTSEHHPQVLLRHQVYAENLVPLITDRTIEIVVVGLNTGRWVTVWAQREAEILYPLAKADSASQ